MTVYQAPRIRGGGGKRRRSAKDLVVPLIISVLGIAGIITLNFLIPDLQPMELVLLFVVVGFGAVGYMQDIVRGLMSTAMLYVAAGVAATFYQTTAPFVGAPFGDEVDRNILALSFGVLTAIIWITLEILGRTSFRDTKLPVVGILDNLGGFIRLSDHRRHSRQPAVQHHRLWAVGTSGAQQSLPPPKIQPGAPPVLHHPVILVPQETTPNLRLRPGPAAWTLNT